MSQKKNGRLTAVKMRQWGKTNECWVTQSSFGCCVCLCHCDVV